MKSKMLIFCTGLFVSLSAYAQSGDNPYFFIINDPDGYTNIRDEHRNIVGKMQKNQVFMGFDYVDVYEDGYGWINYHKKPTLDLSASLDEGYVHISRFVDIYTLPAQEFKHKQVIEWGNSLKLVVEIDDTLGITGNYDFFIRSMILYYPNGKYVFPEKYFRDVTNPRLNTIDLFMGEDNTVYLTMKNGCIPPVRSDADQYHFTIWTLTDYKVTKRKLK